MRRFWILVRKELRSIKKEKTILFAMLIQFFIASFSSIMLTGIMAFYDPTSIGENSNVNIKVGYVGDAASPVMYSLVEKRNIQVFPIPDIAGAEKAFQSNQLDAIVSVPASEAGIVDMQLFLPESDAQSTVILMTLNEPLKKAENAMREANGVQLNYSDLEGKPSTDYEFLYSIIIPLLMFFPALIAGSIVIDTFSEELEGKTLDTLWAAPISLNQIFSSKVFAAILTALFQCALWVGLLRINGFSIENLVPVLSLSVIVAAAVSFAAGIIGLYFKDRERSQFIYSLVLLGAVGLSYLSNPSPFSLLTRLAVGDYSVGLGQVASYLLPLMGVAGVFLLASKRLVAAER